MNCSACGTRVGGSDRNCPNCGRSLAGMSRRGSPSSSSSSSGTDAGKSLGSLSPSSAQIPSMRKGLRQSEEPEVEPSGSKDRRVRPRRGRRKSDTVAASPEPECIPADPEAPNLGCEEIRGVLHEIPDRLEEGLSIFTDAKGQPVGVDFSTDVGLIDLLAIDAAGGLVAVLVEPDEAEGKDLVTVALERVGWIRKHVAEEGQEVRAMVLLEILPEGLQYTAAAVAETVSFKTYRLEVTFCDVDI